MGGVSPLRCESSALRHFERNYDMRIREMVDRLFEETEDEFVRFHQTGFIPSHAYNYHTADDIAWLGPKKKHPKLIHTQTFGDHEIEFRQTGEVLKYTKIDSAGEIVRDAAGNALMMSPEEIRAKGVPQTDTGVTAFHGETPIGFASDEWGTDGVWVIDDYQRLGIGKTLLRLLRAQFNNPQRKIGQMTNAGHNMARSYFRHGGR